MNSGPRHQGVGGWLLLLVISLTVLGPLMAIGQTVYEFSASENAHPELVAHGPWGLFKAYTYVSLVIGLTFTISAGILLATTHDPSAVRFTILALWVSGPTYAALQILATNASLGSETAAEIGGEILINVMRSFIAALIWTLYLLKSKRVKNTYYTPNSPTEAPVMPPSMLSRTTD